MKLYVYEVDTLKIVAEIEGEDNYDCESKALDMYPDTDAYGWTYSPAIGCVDGLHY